MKYEFKYISLFLILSVENIDCLVFCFSVVHDQVVKMTMSLTKGNPPRQLITLIPRFFHLGTKSFSLYEIFNICDIIVTYLTPFEHFHIETGANTSLPLEAYTLCSWRETTHLQVTHEETLLLIIEVAIYNLKSIYITPIPPTQCCHIPEGLLPQHYYSIYFSIRRI